MNNMPEVSTVNIEEGVMKKLLTALIMTLAALGSAQAETWVVVSDENFPPYNFWQNGQRAGIDHEIAEAVLTHIGVKGEHLAVPWSRVLLSLDENKVDMAFQLVGNPERFAKYVMIGPFRTASWMFAVPMDSKMKEWETYEDLRGLTVGVVQGFSYAPDFNSAQFLTKETSIDNMTLIRKLVQKRIDITVGDPNVLGYFASAHGVFDRLRFLPKPLGTGDRYFAFPKQRAEQAERFRIGLTQLKENGNIQTILERWKYLGNEEENHEE